MLAILLQHLPSSHANWQMTLLEAGDGSSDCILPLSEYLLTHSGWQVGDKLVVVCAAPGRLVLERRDSSLIKPE
jgi:hypothetical protein